MKYNIGFINNVLLSVALLGIPAILTGLILDRIELKIPADYVGILYMGCCFIFATHLSCGSLFKRISNHRDAKAHDTQAQHPNSPNTHGEKTSCGEFCAIRQHSHPHDNQQNPADCTASPYEFIKERHPEESLEAAVQSLNWLSGRSKCGGRT